MIESKLINCIINTSGTSGYLFFGIGPCVLTDANGNKLHDVTDPGLLIANLDNYAVVPRAEYERLLEVEKELEARKSKRVINTNRKLRP